MKIRKLNFPSAKSAKAAAEEREARREGAIAVARREQPDADRYHATFYNGETIVEVWKGRSARLFRVVGEVI